MQDRINTKALAYVQRREERCLGKVSPNTYLWSCKKGHQWEPKFLEGLHLDGYNEELGLAFEYSGSQHYQIVPFFHPQRQMNLDAQIWRN
ncbi:unnamed protein product [Rhizophagus irregularis]|nr:unnamed protein product [Rhizophagus irregularis]